MPRLHFRELSCLLSTMPRSGSWYSFFFFEYLDAYLMGRPQVRDVMRTTFYKGLHITKAHAHLMCPSFPDCYRGPHRGSWDKLEFKVPGINSGYDNLVVNEARRFDLRRNPRLRIAYIYRNPLDQAVSHYHLLYWRQRPMDAERFRAGLVDWMRNVSIESYIKQYFTYHVMRLAFPQNVMSVSYEELMREPRQVFQKLTLHFGFAVKTGHELQCFDAACAATMPDKLKQLEAKLGHAFGHPEITRDSHMQGGDIGKWRRWLDDDMVDFVRKRFAEFGLSLADFTLAEATADGSGRPASPLPQTAVSTAVAAGSS
jgi:hypothetical protein